MNAPVPAVSLCSGTRDEALAAMARGPLDLLVVGGGITGAGVAREAALRGMKVALVEQRDFAAGTSSRSSKIIHGGVRYLEYLQLGLVRESARERRVLRGIAPHLVHPLPFLYPVWKGESFLKIRAGLLLFDLLAASSRGERSRRVSARESRELLPGLRDPLLGAVKYREYITDDARFTLANIRSAADHGALVANHARAERLVVEKGRVVGAIVRDGMADAGSEHVVRAPVTVNATGAWAPEILLASNIDPPGRIVPSKGIHLLFRRDRLPLRAATFLRSSGGRSGLAMPRGPWVYLGTTDEEYHGDLAEPRAEPDEVDDLLGLARDCFPELELGREDVVATWAGIRPLVHQPGKTTRDMSRHDEVWSVPPGIVTVAGGKLTTYRPMASRVLAAAVHATGRALPGRDLTSETPLTGAPAGSLDEFRAEMDRRLRVRGVGATTAERLSWLYGTEVEVILSYGEKEPGWLEPLAPGVPALRGEVRYAVEEEMALTLSDVLDRRLALLLFAPTEVRATAEAAAEIVGDLLGWAPTRRSKELEAYLETAREHGPRGIATRPLPGARSR